MTQDSSYRQSSVFIIPDIVILTETAIHFLSYWYTHQLLNGDRTVMSVLFVTNVLSWFLGLPLIGNYAAGNLHEELSYLLASTMGAVCVYLQTDAKAWGIGYFGFSYAYYGYGRWMGDWEKFLSDNHYLELLTTSLFTAITMGYAMGRRANGAKTA